MPKKIPQSPEKHKGPLTVLCITIITEHFIISKGCNPIIML